MNSDVQPIRKEIVVEAPQERAFRVFTQNMTSWWPAEHHIGKAELQSVVIEEQVGGRIYERGVDGSECEWGKVLAWEPPRRFLWAWQVSAQWQYDPNLLTEIELVFVAEGPRRTRVTFEHRNLERFGEAAAVVADQVSRGWDSMLPMFAKAAAG